MEATRPLAGLYPAERIGGIRARQLLPRLERLHYLLALERSAWEASRGSATRLTQQPGPQAGSGLDGPQTRFQPSLNAAMSELTAELRLLRREIEQLRRGGIGGPAAGMGIGAGGSRLPSGPAPMLAAVPKDVLAGAAKAQQAMQRDAARRALLSL